MKSALLGLTAFVGLGATAKHDGHKHYVMAPKSHEEHNRIIAKGQKAQKKMKKKMNRKGYPTSHEEHRMMAANGTLHPRLAASRSTIEQDYFQALFGFTEGIQFSKYTEGPCEQTATTSVYVQVYIIDENLASIYNPQVWPDTFIDATAFVEITAEQFEHCQINEAVSNLAEIFTVNGVSTLAGRVSGDFISGNVGDWVDMFLEGRNSGNKIE